MFADPLTLSAPPAKSIESAVNVMSLAAARELETVIEAPLTLTVPRVVEPPTAPVKVTAPVPAVTVKL
jgi:hypothetical protein